MLQVLKYSYFVYLIKCLIQQKQKPYQTLLVRQYQKYVMDDIKIYDLCI